MEKPDYLTLPDGYSWVEDWAAFQARHPDLWKLNEEQLASMNPILLIKDVMWEMERAGYDSIEYKDEKPHQFVVEELQATKRLRRWLELPNRHWLPLYRTDEEGRVEICNHASHMLAIEVERVARNQQSSAQEVEAGEVGKDGQDQQMNAREKEMMGIPDSPPHTQMRGSALLAEDPESLTVASAKLIQKEMKAKENKHKKEQKDKKKQEKKQEREKERKAKKEAKTKKPPALKKDGQPRKQWTSKQPPKATPVPSAQSPKSPPQSTIFVLPDPPPSPNLTNVTPDLAASSAVDASITKIAPPLLTLSPATPPPHPNRPLPNASTLDTLSVVAENTPTPSKPTGSANMAPPVLKLTSFATMVPPTINVIPPTPLSSEKPPAKAKLACTPSKFKKFVSFSPGMPAGSYSSGTDAAAGNNIGTATEFKKQYHVDIVSVPSTKGNTVLPSQVPLLDRNQENRTSQLLQHEQETTHTVSTSHIPSQISNHTQSNTVDIIPKTNARLAQTASLGKAQLSIRIQSNAISQTPQSSARLAQTTGQVQVQLPNHNTNNTISQIPRPRGMQSQVASQAQPQLVPHVQSNMASRIPQPKSMHAQNLNQVQPQFPSGIQRPAMSQILRPTAAQTQVLDKTQLQVLGQIQRTVSSQLSQPRRVQPKGLNQTQYQILSQTRRNTRSQNSPPRGALSQGILTDESYNSASGQVPQQGLTQAQAVRMKQIRAQIWNQSHGFAKPQINMPTETHHHTVTEAETLELVAQSHSIMPTRQVDEGSGANQARHKPVIQDKLDSAYNSYQSRTSNPVPRAQFEAAYLRAAKARELKATSKASTPSPVNCNAIAPTAPQSTNHSLSLEAVSKVMNTAGQKNQPKSEHSQANTQYKASQQQEAPKDFHSAAQRAHQQLSAQNSRGIKRSMTNETSEHVSKKVRAQEGTQEVTSQSRSHFGDCVSEQPRTPQDDIDAEHQIDQQAPAQDLRGIKRPMANETSGHVAKKAKATTENDPLKDVSATLIPAFIRNPMNRIRDAMIYQGKTRRSKSSIDLGEE